MNRKDICKKCKEANHCCNDGADCADFDLTLLNKQDEKIKELEEEHERIKKDTIDEIFAIIDDKFNCCGYIDEISFDEFKNKIIEELKSQK